MARQPKLETPHNLPVKKILKVRSSKIIPTMFEIVYEEGGPVPTEVSGIFTNKTIAERTLKEYLSYEEVNKSYLDFVRDKEYAEAREQAGV